MTSKYEDIKTLEVNLSDPIEQIKDLISFICSEKVSEIQKYNLLMDLIQYFENEDILSEEIKKIKTEKDNKK